LSNSDFNLSEAFDRWWRRQRQQGGVRAGLRQAAEVFSQFLCDSLPAERRRRYGDIDYDWAHRVDTTSATVSWRTRLMGLLSSPYQPIPPEEFREMMSALGIDFRQFTFIDLGSGKGRALLLASEYGFRRVIGIELLPELHRIAQDNLRKLKNEGKHLNIELVLGDATKFVFPREPMVMFLFNPLPEPELRALLSNIASYGRQDPGTVIVIYANPVYEQTVRRMTALKKTSGTGQYSIFRSTEAN
jgi:SAM-dependent methyltransferase